MPSTRALAFCLFLFVLSAIITTSLRTSHTRPLSSLFQPRPHQSSIQPPSKLAFATFLAKDTAHPDSSSDDADDGYFLGARVLAYQLLHAPATRSNTSIPFLVLTTADVSARKRARLARDGATVLVVDKMPAHDWIKPADARWADVLAKLRLFQLTAYSKICFVDADTLVTGPLEGVFEDAATDAVRARAEPTAARDDEAMLPQTYMFAGKGDSFGYEHAVPPAAGAYLNAGFFVFAPSQPLFEYYVSLLKIPGRFDPAFPEQNLFNYAHRADGNMPWQELSWRWNANWPTMRDLEAGVRSFHAKYWDGDDSHDPELKALWRGQRREMEGYYAGVDDVLEGTY